MLRIVFLDPRSAGGQAACTASGDGFRHVLPQKMTASFIFCWTPKRMGSFLFFSILSDRVFPDHIGVLRVHDLPFIGEGVDVIEKSNVI